MNTVSKARARLRHADCYIRKAIEISKRFHGSTATEASREADQCWPQIRHAIEGLVAAASLPESADLLVRLLREAADLLNLRARSAERVEWLENIRDAVDGFSDADLQTSVLSTLGNYYRNLCRLHDSQSTLRQALGRARFQRDLFEEMRSLAFLGFTLQRRGKHGSAITVYEAAALIGTELDDRWWVGSTLLMKARCEHVLDRESTVSTLAAAERIASELGEHRLLSQVHSLRSSIAIDNDDTDTATKALHCAIEQAERVSDHWNLAADYTSLGRIAEDQKRLKEARELFERALASGRRVGNVLGNIRRTTYLARVLRGLHRSEEALKLLDSLDRVVLERSPDTESDVQLETARCYAALRQASLARQSFAATLRAGRSAKRARSMGKICDALAAYHADDDDLAGAFRWKVRALRISTRLNGSDWVRLDLDQIEELIETQASAATSRIRRQLSMAAGAISEDRLKRRAAEMLKTLESVAPNPRREGSTKQETGSASRS